MTVKIKDFIVNEKLPKFLSNNKILLSFDKVGKVFPGIGLPNCKENVALDNAPFVRASAINFITTFRYLLEDPISASKIYIADKIYGGKKISEDKFAKLANYSHVIKDLYNQLHICQNDFIVAENDKIVLRIAKNVL